MIYGWYVKGHFEADASVDVEDLAPLRFHRFDAGRTVTPDGSPRLRIVNIQVLAALGLIVVGAVAFVDAVGHVASSLGVSQVLLALVIAPIATELPEKFNSILWVRQGKDTLAMGNITGAMVFQSAIPVSVALIFAPESWVAGPGSYLAFASAGIAFLATFAIFLPDVAYGPAARPLAALGWRLLCRLPRHRGVRNLVRIVTSGPGVRREPGGILRPGFTPAR